VSEKKQTHTKMFSLQKYLPVAQLRAEDKKVIATVTSEKRTNSDPAYSRSENRSMSHPRPWVPDFRQGNFPPSVLAKLDPATLISATQYLTEDLVKANGLSPESTRASAALSGRNVPTPERTKPPVSAGIAGHHSVATKIWEPPVGTDPVQVKDEQRHVTEDHQRTSPKRAGSKKVAVVAPTSTTVPLTFANYGLTAGGVQVHPSLGASRTLPSAPSPSVQSSVININSLKYSPAGHKAPAQKPANDEHRGGIHPPDKVKSTAMYRDPQSVKYISSRDVARRSPSPERLGPLLADGSHARILSPLAMKNLYRFPVPSEARKTQTTKQSNVIINGGDYKVTEVRNVSESQSSASAPNHVVYAKHPPAVSRPDPAGDLAPKKDPHVEPHHHLVKPTASAAEAIDKNARKRAVCEGEASAVLKKRCAGDGPPSTRPSDPTPGPMHHWVPPHVMGSLPPNASSDRYLRELAAAGYFRMSSSSVVWGNPVDGCYPGTPSKVAVKDALLKGSTPECPAVSQSGVLKPAPPEVTVAKPLPAQNMQAVSNGTRFPREKPATSPFAPVPLEVAPPAPVKSEPQTPSPPPAPINLSSKPCEPAWEPTPTAPAKPDAVVCETPKKLELESVSETEAKPKTPSNAVAASPSSDASSISDFSCSSSSSRPQQAPNDTPITVPPAVAATSSSSSTPRPPTLSVPQTANCAKLKKAWLQRMSDESDDSPKSPAAAGKATKRRNSGDVSNSPSPGSSTVADTASPKPPQEPGKLVDGAEALGPPPKKPKKKHRKQDKDKDKDREKKPKDPNKKKRKHKDKESKRSKNSPEPTGNLSLDSVSQPGEGDGGAGAFGECKKEDSGKRSKAPKCVISNSRKYLLGLLPSPKPSSPVGEKEAAEPSEGETDACDGGNAKKNKKKNNSKKTKEPVERPVGDSKCTRS